MQDEIATVRGGVLDEAKGYITQDRNTDYGTPESNFQTIAQFWSTYLGTDVTAIDVATMMILMKCSRLQTSPTKRDNWVDIAGYAACGGEVADSIVKNNPPF
jgi:hypothetical protein